MQIPAEQVKTTEVLEWQGVHLLHFAMSSCSQKVRILLDEKQISWTSHPVNLAKIEQRSDWFRGINPNAVVPVLVHDGRVYNESNDILLYLDTHFPSADGPWFPSGAEEIQRAAELLTLEDELHKDLRAITFTFVMPGRLLNEHIAPEQVGAAAARFDETFRQLEQRLQQTTWLCGDRLTLPDIAWFITLHRAVLAGYPLGRLPRLGAYYSTLRQRSAFKKEINQGALLPKLVGKIYRGFNRLRGTTLAGLLEPVHHAN